MRAVTITLDVVDALGVGQGLRALVQSGRVPSTCSAIYLRVAEQLVSSVRAHIVQADAEDLAGQRDEDAHAP